MVDDSQWEVVSAKPVANLAPELPRMEDDDHEARAEAKKMSAREGGRRRLRGEMRGRVGRGGGGPAAVADFLIQPMGGRFGQVGGRPSTRAAEDGG
jgi:hypothetical protein